MFGDWLEVYKEIQARPTSKLTAHCPECGSESVDFQYVGDTAARRGYLDIWCTHCNQGVHLSRVVIPQGAHVIEFDAPDEVLTSRIPRFKQVTPSYE